jgi:hypothetical protein
LVDIGETKQIFSELFNGSEEELDEILRKVETIDEEKVVVNCVS